jgi:hypothetical protein
VSDEKLRIVPKRNPVPKRPPVAHADERPVLGRDEDEKRRLEELESSDYGRSPHFPPGWYILLPFLGAIATILWAMW